ncbi:MAG TPA: polysaccharide deacetylase family protein [Kofleriaceae bacterium]|jgi:peptidoglycan/xylan/chitin deacetylase (PgdA/CDA1 family)|nr:polysaccharide deacetylase family protein [Kofleriaceae bacterium]
MTAGCQTPLDQIDGAFYNGDHRLVHCAVNLDTSARVDTESIDSALDRARDRSEVVELYAHHPGVTVPVSRIEHVLAGARERGLAFYTYSDFVHDRPVGPGLALSFDDTSVDAWFAQRPLFDQYGAKVTFFVSRYQNIGPAQRAELKQLGADGHVIEPHTVNHLRAPDYVEQHGLDAYLHDEVDPSFARLREDGFTVDAFAYPFGARTGQIDRAIGKRVKVLRSVAFTYEIVGDPCP